MKECVWCGDMHERPIVDFCSKECSDSYEADMEAARDAYDDNY